MTLAERRVKRLMERIRGRIMIGGSVDEVQAVITKEVHPQCCGL